MPKIGMRKHLINSKCESRNYPSSYDNGYLEPWNCWDKHIEYNIKRKPHSDLAGRKPKWRAKRKEQRKFKQKNIKCSFRRRAFLHVETIKKCPAY